MAAVRCPICLSEQIMPSKKGFGVGKALAGGILAGPVGLLAGFFGSRKVEVTCVACGHSWPAGETADPEITRIHESTRRTLEQAKELDERFTRSMEESRKLREECRKRDEDARASQELCASLASAEKLARAGHCERALQAIDVLAAHASTRNAAMVDGVRDLIVAIHEGQQLRAHLEREKDADERFRVYDLFGVVQDLHSAWWKKLEGDLDRQVAFARVFEGRAGRVPESTTPRIDQLREQRRFEECLLAYEELRRSQAARCGDAIAFLKDDKAVEAAVDAALRAEAES